MKVHIDDVEEDGLEVIVHQQDDDSNISVLLMIVSSCCIRTLTSTDITPYYDRAHLGVVDVPQRSPSQ